MDRFFEQYQWLLVGTLIVSFLFLFSGLFILQKLGVKTLFGQPVGLFRQGARNASLVWLALFIIIAILITTINTIFRLPTKYAAFQMVISLLLGFVLLVSVTAWLRGRRKAGELLLDVTHHPARNVFLPIYFFGLVFYAWFLNNSFYMRGVIFIPLLSFLLFVSLLLFLLMLVFGRLQIREQGLWLYAELLEWSEIESYQCKDQAGRYFVFKFMRKGRWPSAFREVVLSIPQEKKNDFVSLLERHLPQAATDL